jgi:hypothetical protein
MFSALRRFAFTPGFSVKTLLIVAAHIARRCGPGLFHPIFGGRGPIPAVHTHVGYGAGKEWWLVIPLDDIKATIPAAVSRHWSPAGLTNGPVKKKISKIISISNMPIRIKQN